MKVHVIRHGETVANVERIWGGDYPLTENGMKQAAAVETPEVALVLTSDLIRSEQTAEIIFPGKRKVPDSVFREMSFGRMENKPIVKGSEELEAYLAEPWNLPESIGGDDAFERAHEALRAVLSYADDMGARPPEEQGDIALVAHRTLIRAMISMIEHRDVYHMMDYFVGNCEVYVMDTDDIRDVLAAVDRRRRR